MVKLSIVILTYNTKDLARKCIHAVLNQYKDYIEKSQVEIIVVDNNSSDATAKVLKNFKKIKFVQNEENYGFSKGNNIGAKYALGKYILFLNSDTEIKDDGFLRMVDFLKRNPKVGILGGKLLNNDGSEQPSCAKFYTLGNLIVVLLSGERVGLIRKSPKKIEKVDWVSGACFMIRKNIFQKLGGFDENFFMYIEDMELCFRAKKQGFLTYFYPDIKLIHKELGSGNRAFAINQIYKGLLYFYKKHKSYPQYLIVKLLLTLKAILAIMIGVLFNNSNLRNTYSKALRFALPADGQGI